VSGEKTEKPTPKKRREARKEGQIARTNDLGGWLLILAATWLLPLMVRMAHQQSVGLFTDLGRVAAAGEGDLLGYFGEAMLRGMLIGGPFVLVALVLGVVSQVAQIGWAPKPLKPDLKRLDVLKGIKGLLGARLATESLKTVLKVTVVVVVAVGPVRGVWEALVAGSGTSVPVIARIIGEEIVGFLRTTAILGLAVSALDYALSKRQVDKKTKMTKQEVKEEHKNQEGDPQLKGQIRARQAAMSRNRMMAQVPNADVVLVNPTHIAVALRYDPMRGAPQVIAKGAGAIADRIRELATEAEVPIVRDVPLARTVYRLCEVEAFIPVELFEAVARVLAFVFTLRARGRAG
jgi:flagellar biosynthesis protein FlhB